MKDFSECSDVTGTRVCMYGCFDLRTLVTTTVVNLQNQLANVSIVNIVNIIAEHPNLWFKL